MKQLGGNILGMLTVISPIPFSAISTEQLNENGVGPRKGLGYEA